MPSKQMRIVALAVAAVLACAGPGVAAPEAPPGATSDVEALALTTKKFNAYVTYMNRTLRALDSLDRYKSWVNMRTGPTGRERLIYGAYEVYDTKDEKAAAEAELGAPPHLPDLDDAMRVYIDANDALAPVLNKTAGYFERKDYTLDHMEKGKALHQQIVTLGATFVAARSRLDAVMTKEKLQLDMIRLATIEKSEGCRARWHAANVMMRSKQALDVLQAGHGAPVDMPAFAAAMKDLGTAVAGLDDYRAEHPGAFHAFSTFPDSFLGRLRDVQSRLARAHGNLRRAAGFDMTFILSDYNTMVTVSGLPMQFDEK